MPQVLNKHRFSLCSRLPRLSVYISCVPTANLHIMFFCSSFKNVCSAHFEIQTYYAGSISITRRSIKTATVGVDDEFPSSHPYIESGGSAPLTFSLPQTPQINNSLPHLFCQYEPRRPVKGWGMCSDQFTWIPMMVFLLRRQSLCSLFLGAFRCIRLSICGRSIC